jgi:hypothetical protein
MPQCKTPCDKTKVCNSESGRCVLRTGKIGRAILGDVPAQTLKPKAKAAPKAKGCAKPCEASKVCNPDSGRCVSRDGKVGRAILGSTQGAPKSSGPMTGAEVERLLTEKGAYAALTKTLEYEEDLDEIYEISEWLVKYGAVNVSSKMLFKLVKPGETKDFIVVDMDSEFGEDLAGALGAHRFAVYRAQRSKDQTKLSASRALQNRVAMIDGHNDDGETLDRLKDARISDLMFWSRVGSVVKGKATMLEQGEIQDEQQAVFWTKDKEDVYPGRYEAQYTWIR